MEKQNNATSSASTKPRSGVIILDPSLFAQERHEATTQNVDKIYKTQNPFGRIRATESISVYMPQSSTARTRVIELINEELFDKNNFREKGQLKDFTVPLTGPTEIQPSKEDVQNISDKVNCGFVTVVEGTERSYYLRCFYCTFEFPISKYDSFCDHINKTHKELEKKYKCDTLISASEEERTPVEISAIKCNREESELKIDVSTIKYNEKESKDSSNQLHIKTLVNDNSDATTDKSGSKINVTDLSDTSSSSLSEVELNEMLSDNKGSFQNIHKYNPNMDHSYSQETSNIKYNVKRVIGLNHLSNDFSKIKDSIEQEYDMDAIREYCNEIRFGKTDRVVIMDFLERLKSYPCLWYTNLDSIELYENALNELLFKMNNHWNFKLTESVLRSNLESIKRYYNTSITNQKRKKNGTSLATYAEYIKKCSEIPYVDNKEKNNAQLMQNNEPLLATLLPKRILRKFAAKKEKRYFCPRCSKGFFLECNYNTHVQLHSEEIRPYKCDICDRHYLTQSKFQQHKKRHDPPKYVCSICSKKYYFSYNFEMHMKTHAGTFDFVCEWCGKAFVNEKPYMTHVKYKHNTEGYCKICRKPCQTAAALDKHLKTHHRPLIDTCDNLKYTGYPLQRKRKSTIRPYRNRKYKFIIDPETKKRRVCCPNCDKHYFGYDSLYTHITKIHGYDPPKETRVINPNSKGRWPKKQTVVSGSKNNSEENHSAIVKIAKEKRNIQEDQEDFDNQCISATIENTDRAKKEIELISMNDEINYATSSLEEKNNHEKNNQIEGLINGTHVEDAEFDFIMNKVMDVSYF